MTPGVLLITLLPHAIPELVALFLPLAAWIIASRRDDWQDLLAATAVTVAIAVPTLLAAAAVEIWVSPHLMNAVSTQPPPLLGWPSSTNANGAARRPPRQDTAVAEASGH